MLIQSIDCDNIEKFFIVFPQRHEFLVDEKNFHRIKRKGLTDDISLLGYAAGEYALAESNRRNRAVRELSVTAF